MPICPQCISSHPVKNGRIYTGKQPSKQRFLHRKGGYQFAQHPTDKRIDQATRELFDRLLLERILMAGIAQAMQVLEWLQDYVKLQSAQAEKAQMRPNKSIL